MKIREKVFKRVRALFILAIDILDLLEQEAPHYAATTATAPETTGALTVHGDARLLRRLVRNLLDNARRHADKGTVEASVSTEENGTVVLRVDDDGPGVAESERERIFEPFYRSPGARETGDGFGLGLSLVRQIAQRHGGQVHCLPRESNGTRFEVVIPSKP